ncbi:MAG: hypothetical protein HFF10_12550, partial [Angelakisella sp.]|nr:hypothetical protein [Angelakisella sp.]
MSESNPELTATKEVEVYGLAGQALRWATPAQYFLAKGQTPPWVRDSGPLPETDEDEDEDEEPLPEEDSSHTEEIPEAPEEPTEPSEETPGEIPDGEPGFDTPALDETPEPGETPNPEPEEIPEEPTPEETPEPTPEEIPEPVPEETPDPKPTPEPDPAPAEDAASNAPASDTGEDMDSRTLAAYVEDGVNTPAQEDGSAGEEAVPEENTAPAEDSENSDAVPPTEDDSAPEETLPAEKEEDTDTEPAPEETPSDGNDVDKPTEPAEPAEPVTPSESEDTTPNNTENTDDPNETTTPEEPVAPAPEDTDESSPEKPAAPEEKEPEKTLDETDLSKADEMYPGGEFYDLELMPEDFFLPPFPTQGEEENKPRKAARATPGGEGEGFIHNYFLWDGTIVTEDGAVESLESGTYLIAIEPLSPTAQGPADDPMKFWGFLPFTVDAETFESKEGFITKYPIVLWTKFTWGDPVDLRSGNLIWEYEDLAIEAKERFAFTHTYESLRAGHDFSIGSGWEHPYNYSLIVTPLYLKMHTPGKPSVTYPIDYSGELIQPEDGPVLSEGGSGYVTTLEDGTIAEFGLQGGPVRVTKPDGKVLEFTGTERGYAASVT